MTTTSPPAQTSLSARRHGPGDQFPDLVLADAAGHLCRLTNLAGGDPSAAARHRVLAG